MFSATIMLTPRVRQAFKSVCHVSRTSSASFRKYEELVRDLCSRPVSVAFYILEEFHAFTKRAKGTKKCCLIHRRIQIC